jgi:hypothetical protein
MNRTTPLVRRMLPLMISVGLLAWLVWWISPQAIGRAAATLRWKPLLAATSVMVLALYFWDAACLPVVYRVDGRRWGYWRSLHLRGLSYLAGAVNYELGQAVLAWAAGRMQQTSVVRMLARTVVLAYHDVLVLLSLGLLGAALSDDPRVASIRPYIAWSLGGACVLGLILWILPAGVRARLGTQRVVSLFDGWSLHRSFQLLPLRLVYFGILLVYATVALEICQVSVDGHVVLSTVPLVMLADGLPSVSGLGTRDATMQLLLKPPRPEMLLAMSLFWSTGMVVGRLVIGLAHLWGDQLWRGFAPQQPTAGEP